jgi:hypothetical protein
MREKEQPTSTEPELKDEAPAAEGDDAPAPTAGEEKKDKEQKRREPETINSRAAAFGDAPSAGGRGNQVCCKLAV